MIEPESNDRELEQELKSLAPAPLSEDFLERLEARWSRTPAPSNTPTPSQDRWGAAWWIALAVAAAVAVAAWRVDWEGKEPDSVAVQPSTTIEMEKDLDPLPTLANFRRAESVSPEALDRLLSQQARNLLPSVPDPLLDGMWN